MKQVNEIKDQIQRQAHAAWLASGRVGTLCMGTGAGKSKIAVDEVQRLWQLGELTHNSDEQLVLLVTPTEKLRDENWPNEFKDWGQDILLPFVKRICFASLKNEKGNRYKFVIMDEFHRISTLAAAAFEDTGINPLQQFLSENLADAVMGLTATVPDAKTEREKASLIEKIAPVVFSYTLDQGVTDGMIADYHISVIMTELDAVTKNIKAGTVKKPFMTTEFAHYNYLESLVTKSQIDVGNLSKLKKDLQWEKYALSLAPNPLRLKEIDKVLPEASKRLEKAQALYQIRIFARNKHLYSLPSKEGIAKRCIKQMAGKRSLIFCGEIQQCENLCQPNTFHSKTNSAAYEAFNKQEIDMLGVVNAADEGINFTLVDTALMTTVGNSDRKLTQRVGRCLRWRENHKAAIFILCAKDTVEERWLENSIKGFDPNKISYYSHKSVPV